VNALVRLDHAFDRAGDTPAGKAYKRARVVEGKYARQLRKVAQVVQDLIAGFDLTDPAVYEAVQIQLEQYAKILDPWARSVTTRMITEMSSRDLQGWKEAAARIGRNLRREIDDTPVGGVMQALLNEQTSLITSIPREAAERVRKVTLAGITEGKRPAAYIAEIMRTGEVSRSRATLIARTEVARTGSVLTQTRAQSIGCTHFIWRTIGDSDVRPGHRRLNGKAFEYLNPPLCDPPDHHSLPGQIFNCRCVGEPIIPF
jgi:SPP1 gp7 family putative phage head morphogenesis protein